jgi:hypothetical protein
MTTSSAKRLQGVYPNNVGSTNPSRRLELNKFEAQQYEKIPLPEGALQEKAATTSTLLEPNLASTENAVPEGDIGLQEILKASTQPRQNVGTYKQGPANTKISY